ncbi:MAG: hypothetical protein U0744_05680 [Gemmataceae bacterium]
MSRKSWWLGGMVIAFAANLGCCRWCDRHCGSGNSGYAPVAYAPAAACCTPCAPVAASPAPAACPPGCAPAQGFQRSPGTY